MRSGERWPSSIPECAAITFGERAAPEKPPRMRCSQVRSLVTPLRRSSTRRSRSYSVNWMAMSGTSRSSVGSRPWYSPAMPSFATMLLAPCMTHFCQLMSYCSAHCL